MVYVCSFPEFAKNAEEKTATRHTESVSSLCHGQWSRDTPSPNSPRGQGSVYPVSMCHARTTKGSQLNLDEVDEILSCFFKPAPATAAGRERLLAEEEDGNPATQASGDPLNHPDSRDRYRKAMPGPRGGSSAAGGAGGGRREAPPEELPLPAEGEDRQTAAGEAAPRDSSPPGGPSHRPPRERARSRKKIRFTGELGAFLDGEGMWSDVAVMEAERKAGGNILPQQDDDRIEIQHREQEGGGHETPTGEEAEEGKEREETQEEQEEGGEGAKSEVAAPKVGRGEIGSEGEGGGAWKAAAGNTCSNLESSLSSPCPVVAADPRGSPVSSDPTSTSAGDESPERPRTPSTVATPPSPPPPAAAAVVGRANTAAGEEKKKK